MERLKRVFFKDEPIKPDEGEQDKPTFIPMSEDGNINVHPDTRNPSRVWETLKVKQKVEKVKPLSRKTSINPKKVRFVCISDTHNQTSKLPESVPDGDVLLHAGDFTSHGQTAQVEEFNEFLGKLPHKHKVVIAGNHDMTFDLQYLEEKSQLLRFGIQSGKIKQYLQEKQLDHMSGVLTNCTHYLEDSSVEIYGIKIYGSPWQPWFGGWGFNLERGQECLDKWNMMPTTTDILMTHGPPLGHGDYCSSGQRAGCVELLHTIQHRIKPKYHVFGHIHEGYGVTTDGSTTYVNASTCTLRYKPTNPPIIFDIPLPEGHTKDELPPTQAKHYDQMSDVHDANIEEMGACAL